MRCGDLVVLTLALTFFDIAAAICTAPTVANALVPSCLEGSSIADGSTCTTQCLPGVRADYASLGCRSGVLTPLTFSCGVQCVVPDGERTATVPCAEGRIIQHGQLCTSQCAAGLAPYETQLRCYNGELQPSSIIHCRDPCIVPIFEGANDPPCKEGSTIPEHGVCTPQCDDQHVLVGIPLRCSNGTLSPPTFSCRKFDCTLPATEIWTHAFPGSVAQDYPAEFDCPTTSVFSQDGNGCEKCYAPDLTINAVAPGAGLGVGRAARLRLSFSSIGGRRLLFKTLSAISVTWGLRNSESEQTWSTTYNANLAAFGLSTTPVAGIGLGVPAVNSNEQIDTGAVTGLETTVSSLTLVEPLILPLGAEVLRGLSFTIRYVIAGCSFNRKGYGSLMMSVLIESLAYNTSTCASEASRICVPQCGQGFSGNANAICPTDDGTFKLQGCYSDCQALPAFNAVTATDGIVNAQDQSCLEGASVRHGTQCTASCIPGFTPVPAILQCDDGRFDQRFQCHTNCIPPVTAHGGHPPCEELLDITVLPHGGKCTPRCSLGYRPVSLDPLACSDGLLSPSTFRCAALLVPVFQTPSMGAYRWVAFAGTSRYLAAAANTKDTSTSSFVYKSMIGDMGMFSLNTKAQFESTVVDVVPLVVETSVILLATILERELGQNGIGGLSPIYRYHTQNDTLEVMQQLPIRGATQIKAAFVGGEKVLIVGSCKPPLPSSLVFSWNTGSMTFNETQQIDIAAQKLEAFAHAGNDFLFAATSDYDGLSNYSSQLYQWKFVNGIGQYHSVLGFPTPFISALAWLGCRNEPSYADAAQRPCYMLTAEYCVDEATRRACGLLCGCGHNDPLMAFAFSYDPAAVIVVEVISNLDSSLRFDTKQQVLVPRPINALCSFFSSSRQELFLFGTVTNDIVDSLDIETSSRLYVLNSSRFGSNLSGLELVESVQVRGSTCTSILGVRNNDYVLLSGPHASIGVSVFALEGNYIWHTEPWTPCSPSCRLFGFEVSFRQRTVSCRGVPSGFIYKDALCPIGLKPVSDEKCNVNICSTLHQHEWRSGLWGPCEGDCGVGTRYRTVHCISMEDGGNGTVVDPSNCSFQTGTLGVKPSSQEACDLQPCSSFRIVNRAALEKRWHVKELRFYLDDACEQTIAGAPFSAGSCTECVCKNASGIWGECTPDLAFDGNVPYFTDRGQLIDGTAWISQCGEAYRCNSGETWIGIHSDIVLDVRCVRIYQSGDPLNAASEIALESWDRSELVWTSVVEWAQVGIGKWVSLVVERACSSILDCTGKGTVEGLPGHCVCTCDRGYTGLHCNLCAVGFEGYPTCHPQERSSRSWRLIVLEVPPSRTWHVADITMHTDLSCSAESQLPRSAIRKYIASYEGAEVGTGPERAFDAEGSKTVWISNSCADTALESCNTSAPWIGIEFIDKQALRCIRIQQGHKEFAADAVALQLWSTQLSQESWAPLRDWRGITVSTQNDYSSLRLVCEDGIPAADTIEQDCDTEKLPWEQCQAWCRPGFTGATQTYICGDNYVFQGVQPSCQPNECTRGIPNGQGVVIDDCLGKTMEQKCQATCGSGYSGASVNYICLADAYWHEELTLRTGVVPACIEGLPVVQEETVSRALTLVLDIWILLSVTNIIITFT